MKERVVLFDGTNLDGFYTRYSHEPAAWDVKYGTMTVTKGDIISYYKFGDAHIHVEFKIPYMPDKTGQDRGNSGVYIQGLYEIQVLDTYGKEEPLWDDCAGIYKIAAPLTNASYPPEEWQTYDIYFRAPRFNEKNEMIEAARATIIQNGICIHNNIILHQVTPGGLTNVPFVEGPLMLQDHGDPVSFRNIWIEVQ